MNVRPYEATDDVRVQQLLKAQPFEYILPPLHVIDRRSGEVKDEPSYISKVAVLNGDNKPVAFGFSRIISESYLLLDHSWGTPSFRWDALRFAHDNARDLTIAQGIDKSVTWLPGEIERSYGRRLESLGWDRQERTSFVYTVKP